MRTQGLALTLIAACLGAIHPSGAIAADFRRTFHVTGLPDTKRGQRVDLSFGPDDLIFEGGSQIRPAYLVPYRRVRQALLLRAERHYEKATIAAATATGAFGVPIGGLLMLKKHKVDTLVIDYENERGGRMGVVLQLEKNQGQDVMARFREHGITVVEPSPAPPAARPGKKGSTPKNQE